MRRTVELYREPGEERTSQSIEYGPAVGGQFANMIERHLAMRQRYPDRKMPHATPYEGMENLRPETQALVDLFHEANSK